MIIDIEQFIESERPYWTELESMLERLDRDATARLDLEAVRRFHYLYERVSSSLVSFSTFAAERETKRYLEALVSRAYAEIHETRDKPHRLRPLHWFFRTFPRTFRRHARSFKVAAAALLAGCLFGGGALTVDPASKDVLLPYPHLSGDPSERVAAEEDATEDRLAEVKAQGAAW